VSVTDIRDYVPRSSLHKWYPKGVISGIFIAETDTANVHIPGYTVSHCYAGRFSGTKPRRRISFSSGSKLWDRSRVFL